ncbi:hypothetical protein M9M90_07540 [Phenylobacterium sp. LH3H17]|uniref:hypothetical protein n=1 Tax=Phenylobacterium sp. LH3H17 TaxID=2903901 RepID=UPI0020C9BA4B|nr:hypothetical protein [Phenylobacterium sp. LH3H17]UTP41020.1 hypothetical protein M9M90_07540 [Phenylobacterium sp. LH3H17]
MIIAGWILALLGLAQVVFAGTIEVSQLTEGNRLIGLAPSVVANADLVGQRAMIHQAGCATFLAGVVFIGAAYLKPAPPGQQTKAWTSMAAIAALVLTVAALGGFGAFLYALHVQNADQRLVDEIRAREAKNLSTDALMKEAEKRLQNEAEAAAASR